VGQNKPQEFDKTSGIQKSPVYKTVEANATSRSGTRMGAD